MGKIGSDRLGKSHPACGKHPGKQECSSQVRRTTLARWSARTGPCREKNRGMRKTHWSAHARQTHNNSAPHLNGVIYRYTCTQSNPAVIHLEHCHYCPIAMSPGHAHSHLCNLACDTLHYSVRACARVHKG